MASVKKRTDGRPGYVVRWRDESGTQRKKSFSKKALADRYRAEVEHTLSVGSYVDPVAGKVSFRDYAEQWRAAQPHRPNTATNTRYRLTKHVYPVIGNRPIAAIRTSELQALVSGLNVAPSSAASIWTTTRAVLAAALRDRLVGRDPALGVKVPAVLRAKVVPLAVEEVQALAEAIAPRYRALVLVGAGSGLRQGELFGLRVSDVDYLRKIITVAQQIQTKVGGGTAVVPLKNTAAYRVIPVGQTVIDALAAHLAAYPAKGDALVFTDESGEALRRQAFDARVWGPARVEAGVPKATCHDLRHWFASVLIAAGRNVKTVSERLGHSDAAMTLNVYSHLFPTDDDLDRRALDDVFAPDVPRLRPAKGSSA